MQFYGDETSIVLPMITLAAKQWGDPADPTLLCFHGWLDNAGSFNFLAPLIQGYHVIAVDLPGHGHSQHLAAEQHYHLTEGVQTIAALIDTLGLSSVSLMGHSLGGAMAMMVASSFSERIDQLILLDAMGPLSEEARAAPERLGRAVASVIAAGKRTRKSYPSQDLMVEARATVGGISREAASALVLRGSKSTNSGFVWRFDDKLLLPSFLYLTEEQVLGFLSAVTVPTLLVEADDGILSGNSLLPARIAAVPSLAHTIVSGHHHLHMDSAELVAREVNVFLN